MQKTLLIAALCISSIVKAQIPQLVKDINPLAQLAGARSGCIAYKNKILFTGDDGIHGREPWISDGTAAGTYMLRDINPAGHGVFSGHGEFQLPVLYNEKVYFVSRNTNGRHELWETDGTTAGTQVVAFSGGEGVINQLTVADGKLYMDYDDTIHGNEPWISNGTAAGTHMLKDMDGAGVCGQFIPCNGKVFFNQNFELAVTDGTEAGTQFLHDAGQSVMLASELIVFNNKVYFSGTGSSTIGSYGNELWVTDGTDAGTHMLIDIVPGNVSSTPRGFIVYNGKLYFTAGDVYHNDLYVTDGTAAGTVKVKHFTSKSGAISSQKVVYKNKLYFGADEGKGGDPWYTDGTTAGTVKLKAMNNPILGPGNWKEYNGRLYFTAPYGIDESSLWVTDGTTDSTKMLLPSGTTNPSSHGPVLPAPGTANPLVVSGSNLYFVAYYNNATGAELYRVTTLPATSITAPASAITGITLYPNPVTDAVTIEGIKTGTTIQLYDVQGKLIYKSTATTAKTILNTTTLVPGNYILLLTDVNGLKNSYKLVKE